jgi:membrane-associated phospholipid phosphatase
VAPYTAGFMPTPLQPCWGQLRPMALRSGKECAAPGAPKFSNNTKSDFYAAAIEVYKVGLSLSSEQKIIAEYWADNPGDTGTLPGHWIAIVSQIARNDNLSPVKAAEAYVRVGIAVRDAFIGCWYTKYAQNVKRPVTHINETVQGQWRSYVSTPPFPSYPSGHSVQSGAVAHVLSDMFGQKSFLDTTHSDHGLIPLHQPRMFKSFQDAAAEAAVSRLYGGIHYSFDNRDGLTSGECIGETILKRIQFKIGSVH